jgi:hypothetical protein
MGHPLSPAIFGRYCHFLADFFKKTAINCHKPVKITLTGHAAGHSVPAC